MLAIDGLYLIDDEARSQNRVDRMANVTPEMNVLAKRFKTPLIATTQAIQKGVYNKADSIPHMDDVMWNTTASQDFYAFIGIERPVKRPGVEMARYTLNGWEGDFETYFDEDNHKYKVPITIPLISMLVDKYRGTRNCESRKVALWAEDDGGITQKLLPNYKV